jgi:hypothetical protein
MRNVLRYANLVRLKVLRLEHNQINRLPGWHVVVVGEVLFGVLGFDVGVEDACLFIHLRAGGHDGDNCD